MLIQICVKQLGSRKMQKSPYDLEIVPGTLRALIVQVARQEAESYNARMTAQAGPQPTSESELRRKLAVGKVGFGAIYGDRPADIDKSIRTAITAFEDGLVRIFREQEELTVLDAPLCLNEGDCLTFLRLTMLTGSPL